MLVAYFSTVEDSYRVHFWVFIGTKSVKLKKTVDLIS